MTKWFHKCSFGWMQARQTCLTASDIKELLPVTKSGRKRTITDETYIKVLANKLVRLTSDDCISTGVMARGHILEPYAIEAYNDAIDNGLINATHLYHWDDVVVTRHNHLPLALGFSPDAMAIEQKWPYTDPHGPALFSEDVDIQAIGEVKSYSPDRHMISGFTDKKDLEERWQVATAMATRFSIKEAFILFYNPSMRNQLYVVSYDRSDLSSEIDTILETEANWLAWVDGFSKLVHSDLIPGNINRELEIVDDILEKEKLNPVGERSVVE